MEIVSCGPSKDFACPRCKSVLRVNGLDIKDSPERGTYFMCVVCGEVVGVPHSELCETWKKAIKFYDE